MYSERVSFLILVLKVAAVGKFFKSLLNFVHSNGPRYLIQCFPQRLVSKRGKTKSLFLSECVERLRTKRAETFSGASPFLTLYISGAVSCKRLLYNVGKSARPKSSL